MFLTLVADCYFFLAKRHKTRRRLPSPSFFWLLHRIVQSLGLIITPTPTKYHPKHLNHQRWHWLISVDQPRTPLVPRPPQIGRTATSIFVFFEAVVQLPDRACVTHPCWALSATFPHVSCWLSRPLSRSVVSICHLSLILDQALVIDESINNKQ